MWYFCSRESLRLRSIHLAFEVSEHSRFTFQDSLTQFSRLRTVQRTGIFILEWIRYLHRQATSKRYMGQRLWFLWRIEYRKIPLFYLHWCSEFPKSSLSIVSYLLHMPWFFFAQIFLYLSYIGASSSKDQWLSVLKLSNLWRFCLLHKEVLKKLKKKILKSGKSPPLRIDTFLSPVTNPWRIEAAGSALKALVSFGYIDLGKAKRASRDNPTRAATSDIETEFCEESNDVQVRQHARSLMMLWKYQKKKKVKKHAEVSAENFRIITPCSLSSIWKANMKECAL